MGRLRNWLRKDRGAGLPEYAMLIGVMSLTVTYGIQTIDEGLEGNYEDEVNDIEAEDYSPTTVGLTTTSIDSSTTTNTVVVTTLNTTSTIAVTSTTLAVTSTTGAVTSTTGGPTTTAVTTTTADPCLLAPASVVVQDLSYDQNPSKYYAKAGFTVTNSCDASPVAGAVVSWTNYTSNWSCITDATGQCQTPAYSRPDGASPIVWGVASVGTPNGWTGSASTFSMVHP